MIIDTKRRPSGIDQLGEMSWGTHFCLFYESKEDLLRIMIPFFQAGLAGHEFCLCVASEPVLAEEAEQALRQAAPDLEQYLHKGQIEIIPHRDWYLKGDRFDPVNIRRGWLEKLDQALARGYAGMRFIANISWLEQQDWNRFAEYEGTLEEVFGQSQIIGICAYSLERCLAVGVLDVVRHHQFTLAKRDGTWESLEGDQLKRAREEALKLNADLERRVSDRTAELVAVNEQLRKEIFEHKQSEEALRTDEYRLQAAIDAADIVLWERDLSSGHITWLGHHEKLLGFAPGELDDNTLASFEKRVHPEDIDELRKIRQRALEERSEYSHEYRVIWRDGSIHWIRAQGRFIYNETGQPVRLYGAVLDITERKRAEEALRKSEQVLREAESLGHTGSWEQNLVTGEIFNTEENLRLFFGDDGSKGADLEDYTQVVHPDDREYVMQRRAALLEEEGPSDIEYRVVWPDGSVHMIFGRATVVRNQLGQPIRVYGTNVDVTERKQAEEQNHRYAARMEALAEISRTFAEAGLDYKSILNTVASRTAELIGDSCVITLFSDDQQRSFPVAFHHTNAKALSIMHEALLHTWQGDTGTQRYQTLLAGNSVYIPSVDSGVFRASLEPEFQTYFEMIGISSVLIVPLKAQGRVIGTLGMTRDQQGDPYTSEDLSLLQNIADRAAMSIQSAQLFRQVEGAREQLGALSRRLLEVQETERRALTTELHDRVGQNLTGLSITLQNMKASLSDKEAQMLAMQFDDVQALVEDTTRQIRDIMAELHLPELEDYGLAAALETYAERVASRGNLELIKDLPDLAPLPLPSNVCIALFRAAQEAISNVLKHANATQIEVGLEKHNGKVGLMVADNGRGFDPQVVSRPDSQTWGLKIMRERIESIGGTLLIESEPEKGTRVTFEIERPS